MVIEGNTGNSRIRYYHRENQPLDVTVDLSQELS